MKIIKHPVTLKDKFTERKLKIQKENSPFAHVQRGENEVFDLFMDQADSLSNTDVAEKCGAVHLRQNMKIAFDLMLENSKHLDLRI